MFKESKEQIAKSRKIISAGRKLLDKAKKKNEPKRVPNKRNIRHMDNKV